MQRNRFVRAFGATHVRAGLVALILLLVVAGASADRTDYNVVLIILDTMRADHMGTYGYGRDTTPYMDDLADEGVVFENCMSPRAVTKPTVTSILTGTYPITHGIHNYAGILPDSIKMLQEILGDEGYYTATIRSKSCADSVFLDRGFDTVYCALREIPNHQELPDWQKDKVATEKTLDWLTDHAESSQPFFLWVFLKDPHADYDPHPYIRDVFDPDYSGPINGEVDTLNNLCDVEGYDLPPEDLYHLIALYDAQFLQVDRMVYKITQRIRSLGMANNTIVIITSDHGDELYEHDKYITHSKSIYQGVIHVPWIMVAPGLIPPGTRVEHMVQSVDIVPTVLEMLGIEGPSNIDGESTVRLMRGHDPEFRQWAYLEGHKGWMFGAINYGYKYIFAPDMHVPCFEYEVDELYYLYDDPLEQNDISDLEPERCDSMRSAIRYFVFKDAPDCDISVEACKYFYDEDSLFVRAVTNGGEGKDAHLTMVVNGVEYGMIYKERFGQWGGAFSNLGGHPGWITIKSLCGGEVECFPDFFSDDFPYGGE